MRAVMCRALTGLDGLAVEDVEPPVPGPGELLIRVRAAGLNFADLLITKGKYQLRPELPFTPGMEIAGEVAALGPGVEGFALGERVMASIAHGGFAELALARADVVVRLPASIDDVIAAGFSVAYGTAYGALTWLGRLQAGETLVVHGAAGGVGLAAVECGKALGACVIATARGAERLAVATDHGADHVIDTESGDLREQIKALTAERGADVVFDPIGGDVFKASLRSIAWEGRLLVIGFASGDIPQIPANLLLVKNVSAMGFAWGTYRDRDPARLRACFETLLAWYAEGKIRPHVSHVLPFADARAALELLASRQATGKVVLTMDADT